MDNKLERSIKKYKSGKFKKAYLQIEETIKKIRDTNKTIIKLVLHFDRFYLGEAVIKERVNQLCEGEIDNPSNFYFIDTGEFEKLIQILSTDEEAFNKIIVTKIDYEKNAPIEEGLEFDSIIARINPLDKINYLENNRQFFDRLFKKKEN